MVGFAEAQPTLQRQGRGRTREHSLKCALIGKIHSGLKFLFGYSRSSRISSIILTTRLIDLNCFFSANKSESDIALSNEPSSSSSLFSCNIQWRSSFKCLLSSPSPKV